MVVEPPIDTLADAEVPALCALEMKAEEAEQLSNLLDAQREAGLDDASRARLDALMQAYRRCLVRKAQALQVACARGLRPPLS
jgi:hypothetical protein